MSFGNTSEEERKMKMLRSTEVDGTNIMLQVERAGYPWWLVVNRGTGEKGEVWTKIFDNEWEAVNLYDFLSLHFAHDHLKKIIGDEERYARVLKLLATLEEDRFFRQAVRAKNERLVESLLGGILEDSEMVA
jgi:hypothetical protein